MKNTIPILKDRLNVLSTKSSYEVMIDFLNLAFIASFGPLSVLPVETILDYIKWLEEDYKRQIEELTSKKPKSQQLDIEDSIEQIKSSTI